MGSASEGAELETAADPASGGIKFRLPAIGQIRAGKFEIRTLDEARNLAAMLSLACPDSGQAGVSFLELMINAIEHGNLGFEEKSELLAQDTWREEIDRRLVTADRKTRAFGYGNQ